MIDKISDINILAIWLGSVNEKILFNDTLFEFASQVYIQNSLIYMFYKEKYDFVK